MAVVGSPVVGSPAEGSPVVDIQPVVGILALGMQPVLDLECRLVEELGKGKLSFVQCLFLEW